MLRLKVMFLLVCFFRMGFLFVALAIMELYSVDQGCLKLTKLPLLALKVCVIITQ